MPSGAEQILINLVENALRHTGERTNNDQTLAEADGVSLIVNNAGRNSSRASARIAERFYRADGGRHVGQAELGLGSQCKGIF